MFPSNFRICMLINQGKPCFNSQEMGQQGRMLLVRKAPLHQRNIDYLKSGRRLAEFKISEYSERLRKFGDLRLADRAAITPSV
jgi:hypothetical protein